MQIIKPDFILTPDRIIQNKAIAFEEKIVAIDSFEKLIQKYPKANLLQLSHTALLPTFANPHVHLEFSANRATLSYGDFVAWLRSVIKHRDNLIPNCDQECIKRALEELIESGTGAIGAVSSYGEDIAPCVASPLKVVLFNEIIGSNPAAADVMYASFLERFHQAKKLESSSFHSAVAIHSPYAVHYILAKKALEIAKKYQSLVSVHYAESLAEREWLDSARGEFQPFFKEFLNQTRPANNPKEFLELFKESKNLFVHMVWTTKEEIEFLSKTSSSIIHCPISNRLLGNGVLDLEKIKPLEFAIATDGLSSNYSLNMYEELRAALFVHPSKDAISFAKELITRATKLGYALLEFEGGVIKEGIDADFQLVEIPKDLSVDEEIYLHIILHTKKPFKVYFKGVAYGR